MISQARLKELLRYEPETGNFIWLVDRGSVKAGSVAGRDYNGYLRIKVDQKNHPAHVLAWFYMTGEWPKNLVDHKNLIRSDNVWDNLREATHSQNQANTRLLCRNKTGIKGVSFHKATGKIRAEITIDGRTKHLGLFDTIEEATAVRISAANKHFGEFAREFTEARDVGP